MLRLPADLELHCTDEYGLHDAGVYALALARPDDVCNRWDRTFETRPPWFEAFLAADTVVYVGATGDVLGRLEDHRDGTVRQASILQVCDIAALRTVWWFDSAEEAFESEYNMAALLARERPSWYVHQR